MKKPNGLRVELFRQGISITDLAIAARVSDPYVRNITAGRQKCSEKVARALWKIAHIKYNRKTGRYIILDEGSGQARIVY